MAAPDLATAERVASERLARGAVSLAYDRYTTADPRGRVLLAHGFGQTRGAWSTTARRLAQAGFEAIAADGRGHGASGWNPPALRYDIEQFVDDARALAAIAAPRPVWVGASMGGLLGLLAQGESSAPLFSALVLVDVTPRWEQAGVDRIIGFMRAHPDGFDSLDAAADAIAAYMPHRPRKTPRQLEALLERTDGGRWRWHWDPRLLDELAHESAHWQPRLAAAAAKLSLPTLLVSGGRSDIVSDATVDEFLALAPHAAHVRIDDATHMVAGDRNDAFTGAIVAFLESVELESVEPESIDIDPDRAAVRAAPSATPDSAHERDPS